MTKDFEYKHHTLIWNNQKPSWIDALDSASQKDEIEEWIQLVGERYPDMDYVDVVNEPFNAPPSFRNALGGEGKTGWDWVITSFELAREYCAPGVKLILNEYNVLHDNGVTNNYLALIDTLMIRGLIDGIGIQGHYFEFKSPAGGSPSYTWSISTIKSNLNRLASRGIPIYMTEFDINEADDDVQLDNYKTYFPIFWEHPGVLGITIWGYVIDDVWQANAYLIDERRAERPALKWLSTYIPSPPKPIAIEPKFGNIVERNPIIKWHASSSATSYNLQVSSTSAFANNVVDTTIVDTLLQINILEPNTRYYWRVSASNDDVTSFFSSTAIFVTNDQITFVKTEKVPNDFRLFQNYPNPFNPSTTIEFNLAENAEVQLRVYDVLGSVVANLASGYYQSGRHKIIFNASKLVSGNYFYTLKAGNHTILKKLIFLK